MPLYGQLLRIDCHTRPTMYRYQTHSNPQDARAGPDPICFGRGCTDFEWLGSMDRSFLSSIDLLLIFRWDLTRLSDFY